MSQGVTSHAAAPGSRPSGTVDESSASRQVREMFSGIAPRYDLLNHLLSMRFDVLWRKRLARRFRSVLASPNVSVLDLCCGTGDLALTLATEMRGAKPSAPGYIFGGDFAHPMLVRAQEKARKAGEEFRLEFLEADALALPFTDRSFDLVTTAFGFRNLANYSAGIAELHRVLRPGGSVAILEFTEPESALFGRLFRFYFQRILPRIGGVVSGNVQAYGYLPSSVSRFPRPAELARLMENRGFQGVRFERWTGGIVALHTARRG